MSHILLEREHFLLKKQTHIPSIELLSYIISILPLLTSLVRKMYQLLFSSLFACVCVGGGQGGLSSHLI